jgi:hypothetical protein
MISDWRSAYGSRIIVRRGLLSFAIVSVIVFVAVIFRLVSTPKSSEISTLLVAAIAASYHLLDESCTDFVTWMNSV